MAFQDEFSPGGFFLKYFILVWNRNTYRENMISLFQFYFSFNFTFTTFPVDYIEFQLCVLELILIPIDNELGILSINIGT